MPPRRLIRAARAASAGRLLLTLAAAVVGAGSIAAIALAAVGGGPVPAAKPLAVAVTDALHAPAVAGITARIEFANRLVDSGAIQGSDPLLSGASGRLWIGSDHRFRLELQSERGDAQLVSDGKTLGVYDPALHVAYRIALPQRSAKDTKDATTAAGAPPSLTEVRRDIGRLVQHATLSGATPSDVAGRPAYTVRIGPRRDGGLIGAAELAWDAAKGVPLRVAIYARGDDTPVLELKVTDISYGDVPSSTFDVPPPQGIKVVEVRRATKHTTVHRSGAGRDRLAAVTGIDAVTKAVPFALSAPAALAGMPRSHVRLLDWGDKQAALVTYGQGLGGLAVVEQPATGAVAPVTVRRHHEGPGLSLPTFDVGGATGQVLPTALGTLVRFTRDRVAYTVVGSVRESVAEAAARGL